MTSMLMNVLMYHVHMSLHHVHMSQFLDLGLSSSHIVLCPHKIHPWTDIFSPKPYLRTLLLAWSNVYSHLGIIPFMVTQLTR